MKKIIMITLAGLLTTGNACAGEVGQWYVHMGIAHITTNNDSDVFIQGSKISGGGAEISDDTTFGLGVGYFFDEHWSTNFAGVFPAETDFKGTGVLEGYDSGKIKYSSWSGFLNYHIISEGAFQPFIGAGFAYNHVSSIEEDGVSKTDVDSAAGPAFKVGFDYLIDENWGAFASLSKAFVDHDFKGTIPVKGIKMTVPAETEFNPLIFQTGLTFRF